MPAKPRQNRDAPKGKFRLGLAGRVALISCGAAIVAALAQWVSLPILVRTQFDNARLVYAHGAAQQLAAIAADPIIEHDSAQLSSVVANMAGPLPGGQAVIVDRGGKIISSTPGTAGLVASVTADDLANPSGAVASRNGDMIGVYPIHDGATQIATAIVLMHPRTLTEVWIDVLWRNALVLVLALMVIAPFCLPLARRALSPLRVLENRIRARTITDKTMLAEGVEDAMLTPLLSAIDETHKRSEDALKRALALAYTDPTTRLPNRLRFLAKLDNAIARGAHLVVIDIDGFRKINLSLGPRVADMVLVAVGARLKAACAPAISAGGMLGRLGADQFGFAVVGEDAAPVHELMMVLERAMNAPFVIDGQTLRVSVSQGAACAPRDATNSTELLKQAELALKEAKKAEQGLRRAFFSVQLLEKARRQSQLEADVRTGIEQGQFIAVFQPKVNMETGQLVGAEALARWRRPDGAVVSPGVFVPIAEELGLISALGRVVMRDACFAAARWNKSGLNIRIAVNVSPYQFNDPDFVEHVNQVLDESGLNPEMLELEITESAAVADPDKVARIMWPLRNRGVRLAVDDFGTGHSNLASITRLPFDVFKIDQQFIRALSTDPYAPAIVEMVLAMAEALGAETVAEGVETAEQYEFLLRRSCDIGQGYHFSPPLPAVEFDAFVRSWRPRTAASLLSASAA